MIAVSTDQADLVVVGTDGMIRRLPCGSPEAATQLACAMRETGHASHAGPGSVVADGSHTSPAFALAHALVALVRLAAEADDIQVDESIPGRLDIEPTVTAPSLVVGFHGTRLLVEVQETDALPKGLV